MGLRNIALGAAALGVAALAWAAGGPALADSGSFGAWSVVCDNARVCTAFGFGELGEIGSSGFLRVTRGAGPADAPVIDLVTAGTAATSLALAVDGVTPRGLAAVPATPIDTDPERRLTQLTPTQSAALLAVLAKGSDLTLKEGRNPATTISLTGSSAALRFMDDRQKRAGTMTALVARGSTPASSVPAPPALPKVTAAPAAAQTGLPSQPSAALQARLGACDDDIADLGIKPDVARLAPGKLFWGVVCSRGAYNVIYSLFLTDEAGGDVEALQVPYANGEPVTELMNIDFDPETQTLTNFDKGRGLGDCGALSRWVWTGQAFALTHQTLMPDCQGVTSDYWPVSYRTR
ncbi:MAG: DUF1176 domain-containing protein [Phenylobacterium sp.]|uniref:DUF1176 domain-containing protein n=1 Tax=Phenylobacterium sp. TaxID=1871053 RepID=UPI00271B7CED|nr:DUF1176 domain-containing protein [Phenylobacterium sp.]MDO8409792.1 DUF1176 domain-containing protein [Phenylobacterium sp.]